MFRYRFSATDPIPDGFGPVADVVEVEPACDLCGQGENCGEDGCTICLGNWNGETGNHLSCERKERKERKEVRA